MALGPPHAAPWLRKTSIFSSPIGVTTIKSYITTKGAIEAFTVTLAAEVASRGITVNAVDPGPTDSGWISAEPELKQALLEVAPFGRLGQPEDAARLIAFLASDAAQWITGQILHSRGGF